MINFKSLVQYTRVVDAVRFPQNFDMPILFVYFSENSLFINDYHKLKLRKADFKYVIIPATKIPRSRLTPEIRNTYKQFGLLPLSSNMKYPDNRNLIVDTTFYTTIIDQTYKPATYRQRAGSLIQNFFTKIFQLFPENYRKILVYSVDITKPTNSFVNKKIFPIVQQIKSNMILFDDMFLVTIDETSAKYRLLISEKDYKFTRVIGYLRKIRIQSTEKEREIAVNLATAKVIKLVSSSIEKPDIIRSAIKNYLSQNLKAVERIDTGKMTNNDIKRLVVASILFGTSGDLEKANRLTKNISTKNITKAIKNLSKQFNDDLLKKETSINSSLSIISQSQEISQRVENKTPEHIFNKRRIDFETNLKKDMTNAFKILETKDIPLIFDSIVIKDKPKKAGELAQSDEAIITIKLKDSQGRLQEVSLIIPKINASTGTFRINGKRKCLINQIVLNPISFPKQYDSKFESSYSMFHVYSKRTTRLKYLEIYMGSFRLPLMLLLVYSFGFDKTIKQYDLTYKIIKEKPTNEKYFTKVPSSYMIFENVDTPLKEELVSSFINIKITNYSIEKEFLSKEYFNDLIIKVTGRIDAPYLITNNLQNIVDPVAKQVLINKQLPFELPLIIQYMATKCVAGYVQERNDLTNQRIRNSELIVHLAQKQLLKAYTEYREQYLAGNKDAKLHIPENAILMQFSNLEIVQDMEYANPLEEIATITKISPVGKSVGGIPDKQAVQLDARNVHPTYYGNIDPLDTAEGSNIGITQQLTVNAYITSARGLFGQKKLDDKEKSGILSASASMIPFVENNEGARIIMATNQAKQMLPLKNPEPPICQSGYESLLTNVLSDSFIKRSQCKGKVTSITNDYIEVTCSNGKKKKTDITPTHLKSGSGKNTLSTFKPIVKENQLVKNKQIIAEGSCISNGTIAMGRNLACCYMPYKGYNFEDGIVISERLVTEDKLTSLHGVNVETLVDKKDKIISIVEIGKKTVKGEPLLKKYPGVLDELLGFTEEENENVDIYSGQIIIKSPGGKVVDIEIFCNTNPETFPLLKPYIIRTNKKYKKPPKEKYMERGIAIKGIKIIFKIEQELKIGQGDKLCNRFGNKGIISLIEKDELMPRTPWGEKVDIIFNPLGVLGRMNIGQLYELYCGLISKFVSRQIIKTKNKTEVIQLLSTIMKDFDTSPGKKFGTKFIKNLNNLSSAQFKKMVDQIEQMGFFPLVIPPFQAPTYKVILPLLKKLGLKTGYYLTLPEFHTKTHNIVPFGYLYIAKLEHIGEMKVHARSTGSTVGKTLQPTAGKSRGGGQRMGEGDTWALTSYNCPILLEEFFGPLSDDLITKNELLTEIIQTGEANFKPTKSSPTKDLLNAYFISLMLGD